MRERKKIAAMGSLLVGSLLAGGFQDVWAEKGKKSTRIVRTQEIQKDSESKLNVYICNQWYDENLNGRIELRELKNSKGSFNRDEKIMVFVGLENYQGREIYTELRKRGVKEVIDKRARRVYAPYEVLPMEYEPWTIYDAHGPGDYLIGVFADDFFVGKGVFEVK
jgi:hypothetical protein